MARYTRDNADQFRFGDGRDPYEKIEWLLSKKVHPHREFESLVGAAHAVFPARLGSFHGMAAGTASREHFENWLLPVVESCAIEQLAGLYKHEAAHGADPSRLHTIAWGVMTILDQRHEKYAGGERSWLAGLAGRILSEANVRYPHILHDDLDRLVREACEARVVGGATGDERDAPPNALDEFDPKRGVPFRAYLEILLLGPREHRLGGRSGQAALLRDAATACLRARAVQEPLDEDAAVELYALIVADDEYADEALTDRRPDLGAALEQDRQHWCFDVVADVARAMLGDYLTRRSQIIQWVDPRLTAGAPAPDPAGAQVRADIGAQRHGACPHEDCSALVLLQAQLWFGLPSGDPRAGEYMRLMDALPVDRSCLVSPGDGPPNALEKFYAKHNNAVLARDNVEQAERRAEGTHWSDICRLHHQMLTDWLWETIAYIVGRTRSYLDARTSMRRVTSLNRRNPGSAIPSVAARIEDGRPREGIALGLLLKQGFREDTALALLDAAGEVGAITPESGDGLDAVETDVWAARGGLEYARTDVSGLSPNDVARLRARSGATPTVTTIEDRQKQWLSENVRLYLERFRMASKYWVDACTVHLKLAQLTDVLGCGRKIYHCNRRLRGALQRAMV